MTPSGPPAFACMVPTPDEPLPSLNVFLRSHWSKEHAWVKRVRNEVMWRMNALDPKTRAKFPLQRAALRVTLYHCGPPRDTSNVFGGAIKVVEDAMRGIVLTDDRPDVLESIMPVQVRVPHKNERKCLIEVWKAEDMTHA